MYIEHIKVEAHGFLVVDATSTDPIRPHDDLVWVGYGGMHGQWLKASEASAVADAIRVAISAQQFRRDRLEVTA